MISMFKNVQRCLNQIRCVEVRGHSTPFQLCAAISSEVQHGSGHHPELSVKKAISLELVE